MTTTSADAFAIHARASSTVYGCGKAAVIQRATRASPAIRASSWESPERYRRNVQRNPRSGAIASGRNCKERARMPVVRRNECGQIDADEVTAFNPNAAVDHAEIGS